MRIIRGLTSQFPWAGWAILQIASKKAKFSLAFFAILAHEYVAKTSEIKTPKHELNRTDLTSETQVLSLRPSRVRCFSIDLCITLFVTKLCQNLQTKWWPS